MHPKNREALEKRVRQAAEAALRDHGYASAVDVLCGMGLLERKHLQDWRAGRIDYLERVVHANLRRISAAMKAFRRWAREKGLRPSETCYRHRSHHLRFSKSGDPGIEKAYRTHYVKSPARDRQAFVQALMNPPAPNERLLSAAKRYRQAKKPGTVHSNTDFELNHENVSQCTVPGFRRKR